ncbi:MAG TPA: MiaB/RimO family radical SAM methylthiotransferase, partial [Gemmatimonadaceae bacterium]|nr:MiaB/RimO family radical SAM methylthiotransferase [Gemmatimonadaceae bacterium]
NQYDTEAVRAMVGRAGAEVVASAAEADVAVFNSCAVTADAEADLRQAVRRAARERPALRTVVMGCAAALSRPAGTAGSLHDLPTVAAVVAGADVAAVGDALGLPAHAATGAVAAQSGARALLRIQDGCDEHCTFCATTLARGANRSRPADALVTEAGALAERHPEIVLTGVHIGSYGADAGSSLGALVERLVRDVPRVRFRLSSLEATEVDDRLRALLAGDPARVAPYLHAPLQSGSDRVLRRMGRHWYTAARYAAAVERIVDGRGAFGLGADVIAGFPGESEDDHRATLDLVASLPFTSLHVFPYSLRPGTPAERLPGRLSGEVVARRAAELRALAARKSAEHAARRAGTAADVVVVGDGAGRRQGLTEDYLSVSLDEPAPPRGARFAARLEMRDGRLTAVPIAAVDHPSAQ